ncbi:MAG: Putative multiple sugar transport protein [Thermotoga sp. 50_1627]|uniref:ABC transporter ATP-binding protein n=1 Tax=Pseudothermotoga sp. TaxID=2033661 RepID=UPI00076CB305|nr:MAG: Putative multiple sugar transport protein [Thermotoga sp. 50_64]KUK24135.1 MAG: Putative multiple sugar transport protein [Thermotoga sp. 50_1627]MBC7116451.1 ABC transporter ATP-binding protein [Pseudothermotoga sp.]MDK2924170.1 inositol-phosphate transport system ATP-binding protein [Pseudothermotoga sp.]HBT39861.1 sugar ABC transporter ATP-binding protein [Pseudothermotoga sp.]
MASIVLENITKKFGKVTALDGVNLQIDDGEFIVLLGPSGSGKTTLMYLIAGIYRPTSGRILFDGRDVTNLPPKERNVGLVFQNWALYPHMKVFDNIAFPLTLKKADKNTIQQRVHEVANMLRIEALLDRYPWQLSGGQQQRVAIARALVKQPQILLFDEPLSNLDALLRIGVRTELKRLQKDLKITSVYVTHDQAEALAIADRIAVINNGKLIQVGTPNEIYYNPRHTFVAGFVGNPPANLLNAEFDGTRLTIETKTFQAPAELLQRISGRRRIVLGFRPEKGSLLDHITENAVGIEVQVYEVESMGREQIVTVSIEQTMVKVLRPSEEKFQVGQRLFLCVDIKDLMLFDFDTNEALDVR